MVICQICQIFSLSKFSLLKVIEEATQKFGIEVALLRIDVPDRGTILIFYILKSIFLENIF